MQRSNGNGCCEVILFTPCCVHLAFSTECRDAVSTPCRSTLLRCKYKPTSATHGFWPVATSSAEKVSASPWRTQIHSPSTHSAIGYRFTRVAAVAPPPLPPLVFAPVEEGGQVIAGGAGSGNSPPPASLVLKLPIGGGKR